MPLFFLCGLHIFASFGNSVVMITGKDQWNKPGLYVQIC